MDREIFSKMNQDQQRWYAKAMIATIMADGRIDEAEEEYLNTIYDQFNQSSEELHQLQKLTKSDKPIELESSVFFPQNLAREVLQTCIAIAISDAEFHSNERRIIEEIGSRLRLSKSEVESVIQWGFQQLAYIFTFAC
ncbi:TerB family tellurite resistance protein [Deltaproteobacteria bacterium TL4]